ncbi:unnamed protein product [Clonostachys rosea f. rosea IK726]|uniref:Uncharacterized protein n=2 Tax=Bionectria ochroleuca TaxID=29856 RepID=A0A0B7K0D0_BIOOC|nr:unnamed protein product [Clonostachys rosea f. rosea IK726]
MARLIAPKPDFLVKHDETKQKFEDPVDRRKRLSRLRQRAWRDRKRAACTPPPNTNSEWKGYGILVSIGTQEKIEATHEAEIAYAKPNNSKLIPPLIPYSTSFPAYKVVFPLSPDHRLITIVQYNVLRAMIWNLAALSMLDQIPSDCAETFGVFGQNFSNNTGQIPPNLQWTSIQRSMDHPYWISVIPFPAMRDNLILMADQYDSRGLLHDVGLGLYEGLDDAERRGFLVWEDPWRASGWEVSEGFVKKWGFLLKGCSVEMETTNRWRELRGEERLVIEV